MMDIRCKKHLFGNNYRCTYIENGNQTHTFGATFDQRNRQMRIDQGSQDLVITW
jgi:hypothetical protein